MPSTPSRAPWLKQSVMALSADARRNPPQHPLPPKLLKSKLLGGSLTLLAGSGLVGVTNLVYNVITARLLGPTGFAHATAVYTILMLMSGITLSFQVVCAKYVAKSTSPEARALVFATSTSAHGWPESRIGLLLISGRAATDRISEFARPGPDLIARAGHSFLCPSRSAPRIYSGNPCVWTSRGQFHAGRTCEARRSISADRVGDGSERSGIRERNRSHRLLFCRAPQPWLDLLSAFAESLFHFAKGCRRLFSSPARPSSTTSISFW